MNYSVIIICVTGNVLNTLYLIIDVLMGLLDDVSMEFLACSENGLDLDCLVEGSFV